MQKLLPPSTTNYLDSQRAIKSQAWTNPRNTKQGLKTIYGSRFRSYGSVLMLMVAIALPVTPSVTAQPVASEFIAQTNAPTSSPRSSQTGYPQRIDPVINDFAQVLTLTEADKIHSVLSELRTKHSVEVVVVTVDSFQKYETSDSSFERFATNLFNTWGIGNAERNDGVLILLSINDRAVRIELGAGYSRRYDAVMQHIIDQSMLPQFKNGQYGEGLYQGSRSLVTQLMANSPQSTAGTRRGLWSDLSQNAADYIQNNPTGKFINHVLGAVLILGFVTVLTAVIVRLISKKVRQLKAFYKTYAPYWSRDAEHKCPTCETLMKKLPQHEANHYLDEGQLLEQQLEAAEYDGWQCSTCGQHSVIRYQSLYSSFKQCPSCNYQTLQADKWTIKEPTYRSKGKALITQHCQYCDYKYRQIVTLPSLSHNSSGIGFSDGSSGSCGSGGSGGSSDGGGASGSWD